MVAGALIHAILNISFFEALINAILAIMNVAFIHDPLSHGFQSSPLPICRLLIFLNEPGHHNQFSRTIIPRPFISWDGITMLQASTLSTSQSSLRRHTSPLLKPVYSVNVSTSRTVSE